MDLCASVAGNQLVDSYEIHLVQEMLAAGDLTAVEKLIRSLFQQLKSVGPRIRNPRRTNWVRCWAASLRRIEHFPAPPPFIESRNVRPIDPQELDLCVRRLAGSTTLDAFLLRVAGEMSLKAAEEDDIARRLWLSQAGEILAQAATASPPTLAYEEIPQPSLHLLHQIVSAASVGLLLLIGITIIAGIISFFKYSP